MESREAQLEGEDARSVEPGVWRYARARRLRVVIDGEDYFDIIQQAMLKARQRILMIGWDFDTRIHLSRGRRWWQGGWSSQYPSRLGSFIVWLCKRRPELEVRILKWSMGVIKFIGRGTMVLDLLRWWPHRQIDFKFDRVLPVGCTQHQKIVVIDAEFAACGGIDLTNGRWDTRAHRKDDPDRKRPGGRAYGPHHDVVMLMEGPVAQQLEELGRRRWRRAGGKALVPSLPREESAWPDSLQPEFEDVEVGIARGWPATGKEAKIDEVEQLFLRQIASARHFIYVENQYFASRSIAEAMARRLAEPDPPEIVIVHPQTAEGWLEVRTMDPARNELVEVIREIDHHDRFHLYVPYSGKTPIYVHAKLMIVDDRVLRIGSANFNNRSMGLDSECDVFIDCDRPGNEHAMAGIRSIRESLLAEHLGLPEGEMAELLEQFGGMAGLIAAKGNANSRHLRPFKPGRNEEWESDLAISETLDPEEREELFAILPPDRGLFRPGSLLAKTKDRLTRKRSGKND